MSDTVTLKAILMGEDRSMGRTMRGVGDDVDRAGKKVGGFGGAWAALGGPVGLGIAAVGGLSIGLSKMTEIASDSIQVASDLNETQNKAQAIFGKSAGAMDKWSDTAATAMGLAKGQALETASSFGDMFLQLGFTQGKAVDMSKDVVQLAADLGSFNNLSTDDVLERISAGFRGEYDSLQKLIPNISAARVEQEAMNLGLVKNTVNTRKLAQARERQSLAERTYAKAVKEHGRSSDEARRAALGLSVAEDGVAKAAAGAKGDITEQAKAQAVLSILHKDGARAAGDFAKTSGGLANQQKILQASFQDVKGEIGTALLPMLTSLGKWFLDKGLPVIRDFGHWLTDNLWPALQKAGQTILPGINEALGMFGDEAGGAGGVLKELGGILVDYVIPFLAILLRYYLPAMAAQWRLIIGVVKGVSAAVSAFTALVSRALSWVIDKIADLMGFWAGMLRSLSRVPGFGWAKDAADKLETAASKAHSLAAGLDAVRKNSSLSIRVNYVGGQVRLPNGVKVDPGQFKARAGGGPTVSGAAYIVGENGPELWSGGTGHITPARQTAKVLASAGVGGAGSGSGGPKTVHLTVVTPAGRVILQELIDLQSQNGGQPLPLRTRN